jgi:hypothetical protein
MAKIGKKILLLVGPLLLIPVGANLWISAIDSLGSNLCKTEVIEYVHSPNSQKKAAIFLVNCGATTDWSVHASVIGISEVISDRSVGNVLRIDSDHGRAWPLAPGGRPIIKANWEDAYSLNLLFSEGSNIYLKARDLDGVQIKASPITKEFIEKK